MFCIDGEFNMKNILVFFFLMFLSCDVNNPVNKEDLISSNWFDRYGNTYRFENAQFSYKSYQGQVWWDVANYLLKDNVLHLSCSKNHEINVISYNKNRIVFDKALKVCEFHNSIDKKEEKFELFNDPKYLVDKEEELVRLTIQARPDFFYNGLRNFRLEKNKLIEMSYESESSIDTTFVLADSIFSNIEMLIQILPIEEMSESYLYGIIDGVNFDIEIVTNKVSKRIECKGLLPEGLKSLVQYVDYSLEQKE